MIIRPSTLQEDSILFILNKLNFIQQTPEINKQQAVQNPITTTGQPDQLTKQQSNYSLSKIEKGTLHKLHNTLFLIVFLTFLHKANLNLTS